MMGVYILSTYYNVKQEKRNDQTKYSSTLHLNRCGEIMNSYIMQYYVDSVKKYNRATQ